MTYFLAPESIPGSLLFLIFGFAFLIKGGDLLIDGAVKLALRFKIPLAFIGLTIVACGTSAPELFTTTYAGFEGKYDLAVSNVLGSNIFNICIILGLTGLFFPFKLNKKSFLWDWVWLFTITSMLIIFSWDLKIRFYESLILIITYFIFVTSSWKHLKRTPDEIEQSADLKNTNILKDFLFLILGLVGLLIGTRLAIKGGVQIGALLGFPDRYIGLMIMALGTSLPELVTSLTAAYKGQPDIAISNVFGSNITNILIALGFSSAINSFEISEMILNPDIFISLGLTATLGILIWSKKFHLTKVSGATLILSYVSYFYFFVL